MMVENSETRQTALSSFTPGPWLRAKDGSPFVYALDGNLGINQMWLLVQGGYNSDGHKTPPAELLANAKLITAAPELLEALKALHDCAIEFSKRVGWPDNRPIKLAEAAIAKAEGRA